jgi:hypothetical protein
VRCGLAESPQMTSSCPYRRERKSKPVRLRKIIFGPGNRKESLNARRVIQTPIFTGQKAGQLGEIKMRSELLRFNGARERDPAIDAWMKEHGGELGAIAHRWFEAMRKCGDEVRELLHDGCPVACLGDAPFGYVNVFRSHVNVGFFHGAALPDPSHMLQGTGKFMRHVKVRPGVTVNDVALNRLIETAYWDIKGRVENG